MDVGEGTERELPKLAMFPASSCWSHKVLATWVIFLGDEQRRQ